MRIGARTERGFSLVEVLVATAVLVVGLVALAQLFAVATLANVAGRQTTHATLLAAQKLEELRSRAWKGGGLAPFEDGDRVGAYIRRWTIAPLPGDPDHTVVIRVSVAHRARSADETQIATLITRTAGDAD